LKEAFIKATGEGLSADLKSFWFDITTPPRITFRDGAGDAAAWQFAQVDLSDAHVSALAVHTRAGIPRISTYPAFNQPV
jgi:phosphopantetheinyl transferase